MVKRSLHRGQILRRRIEFRSVRSRESITTDSSRQLWGFEVEDELVACLTGEVAEREVEDLPAELVGIELPCSGKVMDVPRLLRRQGVLEALGKRVEQFRCLDRVHLVTG